MALEVEPDEAVHVGAGAALPQDAERRDVQIPWLELAAHTGEDAAFPQGDGPAPARPEPKPMEDHVAVHDCAGRVGAGVELRRDGCDLYALGADAQVQVVHAVGIV